MLTRVLEKKVKSLVKSFPILSITGPRQSGKTTLVRSLFSKYAYVNLENPDERLAAEEDPVRFLTIHAHTGVILDEVQRVPDLFSYLQGIVDESREMGKYILTGSQNFLLLEKITQSLAGRVAICHLLPLTIVELQQSKLLPDNLDQTMLNGGYPALYDRKLSTKDFFPAYIQTYVERDVRSITNIGNLSTFQRFIKLCAGRTGQLLNLSGIANEAGINYKTVQAWISILEASFIVFLLKPHHLNFNKRIVKQPKIYFYDTGLLCALLDIHTTEQLNTHYLRGQIFESFIISDYQKMLFHQGLRSNAYFWRDNTGREIDMLLELSQTLCAVEIKSGETITDDFFKGVQYFKKISRQPDENFFLVYGGRRGQARKHARVLSWRRVADLMNVGKGN